MNKYKQKNPYLSASSSVSFSNLFWIFSCTLIAIPGFVCWLTILIGPLWAWSSIVCRCNCSTPWLSSSRVRSVSFPSTLSREAFLPAHDECLFILDRSHRLVHSAIRRHGIQKALQPILIFRALITRSFRRRNSPSPNELLPFLSHTPPRVSPFHPAALGLCVRPLPDSSRCFSASSRAAIKLPARTRLIFAFAPSFHAASVGLLPRPAA